MPLSEHEQKMLAQLEQALAAEDPKFASQMQGSPLAAMKRRKWIIGGLGVLVGLALVLLGVNTTMWVGVGGFAVMVAAVAYAFAPPRRHLGVVREDGAVRPKVPGSGGRGKPSIIDRLDERWERRENTNDW